MMFVLKRAIALILIVDLVSGAISPANYFNGLHVSGNKLLNGQNQGVNRSGMEYACVQGWGWSDGPMDLPSVQAMETWGINAVRGCWLGINLPNPSYGGTAYQTQVTDYVNIVTGEGMAIIIDLHWAAPGTQQPTSQLPMPNTDHSPSFWTSVATAFKGNDHVIFDLFNEPYPNNNVWNDANAWSCWKSGSSCTGFTYTAAGMQSLVTAIRNTGASNVIMIGGLAYSNSLAQWLTYMPTDPKGQLAAATHIYDFNTCASTTCWNQYVAPVAQQVPVIVGEFGSSTCGGTFDPIILGWAHGQGLSYFGWTWNNWANSCGSGPTLITDYTGTPTASGQQYKDFLAANSPVGSTATSAGGSAAASSSSTTQAAASSTSLSLASSTSRVAAASTSRAAVSSTSNVAAVSTSQAAAVAASTSQASTSTAASAQAATSQASTSRAAASSTSNAAASAATTSSVASTSRAASTSVAAASSTSLVGASTTANGAATSSSQAALTASTAAASTLGGASATNNAGSGSSSTTQTAAASLSAASAQAATTNAAATTSSQAALASTTQAAAISQAAAASSQAAASVNSAASSVQVASTTTAAAASTLQSASSTESAASTTVQLSGSSLQSISTSQGVSAQASTTTVTSSVSASQFVNAIANFLGISVNSLIADVQPSCRRRSGAVGAWNIAGDTSGSQVSQALQGIKSGAIPAPAGANIQNAVVSSSLPNSSSSSGGSSFPWVWWIWVLIGAGVLLLLLVIVAIVLVIIYVRSRKTRPAYGRFRDTTYFENLPLHDHDYHSL